MKMKTKLEAKVAAVNRVNSLINKLHPILEERFKPLVGQKILKVDGTLLAKYDDLLQCPNDLIDVTIHSYLRSSRYSLSVTFRTSESFGGCGCIYHEETVTVGDIDGDKLTKTHPPGLRRADYTVEEVEKLRQDYRQAESLACQAMFALEPFGEYDR